MTVGPFLLLTGAAGMAASATMKLAQVQVPYDAGSAKLLAVASIIVAITGLVKVLRDEKHARQQRNELKAKIDSLTEENRKLSKGTDRKIATLAESVRRPLVLIVEDDPPTYEGLALLLYSAGFETHMADTVRLARLKLNYHDPDWMILDLGLPDGAGWEVFREHRRRELSGRVIVYSATGEADSEFVARWAELSREGDLIVPKAGDPKRLIAALKTPPPHKLTPSDPDLPTLKG